MKLKTEMIPLYFPLYLIINPLMFNVLKLLFIIKNRRQFLKIKFTFFFGITTKNI